MSFEDYRKKPDEGYVVLPISTYTGMLSRLHLLEEHLVTVTKVPYGSSIDVCYNKRLIHELACRQMLNELGAEELSHYGVITPDNLSLYGGTLATRKPEESEEAMDTND